jgi:hypothetical protein
MAVKVAQSWRLCPDSHHQILVKIVMIYLPKDYPAIQSELNRLQRSSTEAVFGG